MLWSVNYFILIYTFEKMLSMMWSDKNFFHCGFMLTLHWVSFDKH